MSKTYYDGNFEEASQHGPLVMSIDNVSRGRVWTQMMKQRASFWAPLELDTAGPLVGEPGEQAGVLVDETTPQIGVGDIVKWERIFAEVPPSHQTSVAFAYAAPKKPLDEEEPPSEFSLPTTANITNDYFLTEYPATIPVIPKQRFVSWLTLLAYLGTIEDQTPIIAADSTIERYRGNIWRRKSPTIPKIVLLNALLLV